MALALENRIVKPKTKRGLRALEQRGSKLIENDKNTLLIKGGNTSDTVTKALKDIHALKKPLCFQLKQKNPVLPFEDASFIEKMGRKYDSSLFILGSHSKKRPHNLVLGRMYDFELLDMSEIGITNFKSMRDFQVDKIPAGTKPCLVFSGEAFEDDDDLKTLKSLLIDMFRGPSVERIRLTGVEHLLHFTTIADNKVALRSYRVSIDKLETSSRVPKPELVEMGPHMDLTLRRTLQATEDKWKRASRIPVETKRKQQKKKNKEMDVFGNKLGRVHLDRQDMEKLSLAKPRALKRTGKAVLEPRIDTEKSPSKKKARKMDKQDA